DKIIEVDIEGLYVRCPSYLPYFEGWSPGTLFNIFMKNDNHLFVNLRNDPIAKIINSIIPYTFLLILIILSPLAALVFYFYFIAFKLKQILFQSLTSTAIATLTFFITTSINTNNASFEKFKFASYLLYLGIVAQFLISKELTYLLLSFLSSYSLLVYGTVFLGVTNVKSLYEQHHIYLSLLHRIEIFNKIAINFSGIFKHFIIIFISRGLSVCESKMVEKYIDFHHNDDKIYFWFDEERIIDSNYNHVSFDKNSFNYLEKVKKECSMAEVEEGEIDKKFKIICFKENWCIFITVNY
ncbi:9902_t:CDS:2, partial [Dentiscutata erythropus]